MFQTRLPHVAEAGVCSQHVNTQLMVLAENQLETLTVYEKVLW